MRITRIGLALGLLTASPAQARPAEALACALQAAPAGLDARVADVIIAQDDDRGRATLDAVRALTERCAADQFLDARQQAAYFRYVLGRMGRDGIDTRLTAAGLAAGVIDAALDIGPGNANNPASSVTKGDLHMVARAYAAAGHDPARITPDQWMLITGWITATATMFDALRDLD